MIQLVCVHKEELRATAPNREFHPGAVVRTNSGRVGEIQPKPWHMPHHELLRFRDGIQNWVISTALSIPPIGTKITNSLPITVKRKRKTGSCEK